MSKSSEPLPPAGSDPGPDPLAAVEQFKRAPVRVGCFGCMLTGWMAISAGIAVLIMLIYLIRRFVL